MEIMTAIILPNVAPAALPTLCPSQLHRPNRVKQGPEHPATTVLLARQNTQPGTDFTATLVQHAFKGVHSKYRGFGT